MNIQTIKKCKPAVLVTDFDRTLTYLYKDPILLIELADQIHSFYQRSISITANEIDGETDGYMVWHKLHDIAIKQLLQKEAEEINQKAEKIVADFELAIVKRIGLFPDITGAVRNLRSLGIRLGVVSSNATSVVQYALEEANILTEFEYVEGRPYPFSPELIKPNPYPLNRARIKMKVELNSFWYVGDDKVDVIAAKAAEVTAVGICTGRYLEDELWKAGADLVFPSFVDIPEYFI